MQSHTLSKLSLGTSRPSGIRSSAFISEALAREALTMALLMITPSVQDKHGSGCGFLHIVVMDPSLIPQDASFEQAILIEHSIGDSSVWDADYAMFARAKARLSWEHRADGTCVQAMRPHLLRAGDALLWGGICLDGIAVGVSGAHPWYDEAFGMVVAANLRALCKREHDTTLKAGRAFADLRNADLI